MKCQGCPVASGECIAEKPGWEFACRLAEGTDSEKRFIINRSAIETGTYIFVAPEPADDAPAPDWTAWRRALRLGSSHCLYSSKGSDCGCSGFRCHALGRLATLADCRECLK